MRAFRAAEPSQSPESNLHTDPPTTGVSPLPTHRKQSFFRRFGSTRVCDKGECPHTGAPMVSVEAPSLLGGATSRGEVSQVVKDKAKKLRDRAKSSYKFFKHLVSS